MNNDLVTGAPEYNHAGVENTTTALLEQPNDLERYRRYIEHFDLTDTQQTELLQAIWQIMRNFVDRAFGDDPAQLCRKNGEDRQIDRESGVPPVIDSRANPSPESNNNLSGAFTRQTSRILREEKR